MSELPPEIARKKAELDKLKPLARKSLANLAAWYDVELTYSSNAIEGNTLTRAETAMVLEKGVTVGGKPLKDHLEAVGHKEALGYVRQLASRAEPIREVDVRQIHALVVGLSDRDIAGRYADSQRTIAGTRFLPPAPAEVPTLMGDFGQWLAKAPATPETAFKAHGDLALIHPFNDGNGRTARLVMNLVLLKGGYPPVVIGPEDRPAYIDAMEALSVVKQPEPHVQFLAGRLEASLDHHLTILRRGVDPKPGIRPT